MFYTQPNTFVNWITLIVMSTSLSLIIGAVFWDVPNTDSQLNLNDRLGYHYSVMCVSIWPTLLTLTHVEMRRNRATVERDIKDGLHGRFVYMFVKVSIQYYSDVCRFSDNMVLDNYKLAAISLYLVGLPRAKLLNVRSVHARTKQLQRILFVYRYATSLKLNCVRILSCNLFCFRTDAPLP